MFIFVEDILIRRKQLRLLHLEKRGGRVWEEIEVKVPATEAWKLYGSLQLAKIVGEGLPNLFNKVEVVEGDGSPGTIVHIDFAPGLSETSGLATAAGPSWLREKFTVVDDERRVKEAEVVEGGYLDLGFTLYRVRWKDGVWDCFFNDFE
ncbi:UNVERIFIED_CONTAM: S-norcoclaurine synthase 2 [Sesamum radiatum]|uniref:S-norcoclaurine synthase 2 n=1 Tax=Sesamum radiatum TaxID=300843 RepID=A0AAW2TEF1_SESRA